MPISRTRKFNKQEIESVVKHLTTRAKKSGGKLKHKVEGDKNTLTFVAPNGGSQSTGFYSWEFPAFGLHKYIDRLVTELSIDNPQAVRPPFKQGRAFHLNID